MALYKIISETFAVDESSITEQMVFMELEEWDSMNHMMFITNLEDHYEIDFEGDDIVNVRSVKELRDLLEKYEVTL